MTILKWIIRSLALLVVAVVAGFLHYYLPGTDVVRITGTDVKRMDDHGDRPVRKGMPVATRDVRFINTVTHNGRVRVYRNEDTGWGWPPYFKFDSADITAKATAVLKSPHDQWVAVTSYGWRIQLLSMFPNITSVKVVPKGYHQIPYFDIAFFLALGAGIFFVVRWFRRFIEKLRLDERFEAGTAPLDNLVAWTRTEMASWKKKPKPARPERRGY
jgi:Protein of unknown function (DUF1523)